MAKDVAQLADKLRGLANAFSSRPDANSQDVSLTLRDSATTLESLRARARWGLLFGAAALLPGVATFLGALDPAMDFVEERFGVDCSEQALPTQNSPERRVLLKPLPGENTWVVTRMLRLRDWAFVVAQGVEEGKRVSPTGYLQEFDGMKWQLQKKLLPGATADTEGIPDEEGAKDVMICVERHLREVANAASSFDSG